MTTVLDRPLAAASAGSEAVPALEIRNVSVSCPTRDGLVRAVNDVSFTVAEGRILAVLGESGSGKSVLLRTILGIHAPTARVSGEVLVQGTNLLSLSTAERARLRGSLLSM